MGHNTLLFMNIEMMWVCICLVKLKIHHIWVYAAAICGNLMAVVVSYMDFMGAARCLLLIAATCLILTKSR